MDHFQNNKIVHYDSLLYLHLEYVPLLYLFSQNEQQMRLAKQKEKLDNSELDKKIDIGK